MPVELGWGDVALRLALATLTAFAIGLNREKGHAAGLRTTMLVCLAAALSMIQANLLLNTIGKKPDSFIMLDLMRLPLGILSGMGFIGAGAIFKRGDLVKGVTTAATLWFVTVMGLCFGGGQLGLGIAAFALGFVTLWLLRRLETRMSLERRAMLQFVADADGPGTDEIRDRIRAAGFRIESMAVDFANQAARRRINCELRWHGREDHVRPPEFVERLAAAPGIVRLRWHPKPYH